LFISEYAKQLTVTDAANYHHWHHCHYCYCYSGSLLQLIGTVQHHVIYLNIFVGLMFIGPHIIAIVDEW